MIENIANGSYYFEKYKTVNILINSLNNGEGVILNDVNGNLLEETEFDLGNIQFGYLDVYSGYSGKLLVYDSLGYDLYSEGDILDMGVQWDNGTRYRINGEKLESSDYSDLSFTFESLDSDTDTIYKAYLNDIEIDTSTLVFSDNIITISSDDSEKIEFFDNILTIVKYSTDQTLVDDILINYESVDKILDFDSFFDLSYFDGKDNIAEYKNFRSLTENINSTINQTFRRFSSPYERRYSINNTLAIEFYKDSDFEDIYNELYGFAFRIVKVSPNPAKIIIWNNCRIKHSSSTKHDINGIDSSYSFTYDNKKEFYI